MLPAATPVTVTVCSTFQFERPNSSVAGDTVAVPGAPLVTDTRTLPPGWLCKLTAYAAVP